MSDRETSRPAPGLARCGVALVLLALAGCPRFDGDEYLFLDELEGPLCDGVPCGWTRVAGPDESARWAESLPGEHGLQLDGAGVVVRIEPAVEVPFSMTDNQLALDLIARCDPADPMRTVSTLSIEVGATDTSGATVAFEPMLNVLTTWTQSRPNAVELGNTGAILRSIDSITIAKGGDGRCEIDWIGIAPRSTFR